MPLLVVRIRPDYFILRQHRTPLQSINPILTWPALIAKNLLGVLLLLAGLAMLILPGQAELPSYASS